MAVASVGTYEPAFTIKAGWYWWECPTPQNAMWQNYTARNRGRVLTRGTWQTAITTIVLFEVKGAAQWDLPGRPQDAPKKDRTELRDLTLADDPSPGFIALVETTLGAPFEAVRDAARLAKQTAEQFAKKAADTAKEAGTALRVLVWGGAAILLINLFRRTEPSK